jgi:hypothetical protein
MPGLPSCGGSRSNFAQYRRGRQHRRLVICSIGNSEIDDVFGKANGTHKAALVFVGTLLCVLLLCLLWSVESLLTPPTTWQLRQRLLPVSRSLTKFESRDLRLWKVWRSWSACLPSWPSTKPRVWCSKNVAHCLRYLGPHAACRSTPTRTRPVPVALRIDLDPRVSLHTRTHSW